MSDAVSTSAIGADTVQQTPENTTAPFEQLPLSASKKSGGFTKEMREEKIRNGWVPPHLRNKNLSEPHVAKRQVHQVDVGDVPKERIQQIVNESIMALSDDMKAKLLTERKAVEVKPVLSSDQLLEALVTKLVAIENNGQFRSIWLHFFQHGGVYSGPNYLEELQAACEYLNSKKVLNAE